MGWRRMIEAEFVNDWSELEAAVDMVCAMSESRYVDILPEDPEWEAFKVVVEYVPRLLTQYAKLLELSYVLTDLVEKQNALNTPTGLYLPDHR
jgi:hypothetical protein